ncbi:MAG: reductase [Jatrophihabitans sp.]|nr:MAG: reductase [Jatrophihabitans sp.]
MRRAIVLGGTGVVGRAVAAWLRPRGWRVDLVARTPREPFPDVLVADRYDPAALRAVVGGGADLLVDCLCYTAAHASALLPLLTDVGAAVVLSARAVYVDDAGHHVNSDEPVSFAHPVTEQQPTVAASGGDDFQSRCGYAACKVAAEQVLLDSGLPVSVLRASKIHGAGSARPVSEVFVARALAGNAVLRLAHPGYADHLTAAANVAQLVDLVAAAPGARILNVADADVPSRAAAAGAVAAHLGHHWKVRDDPGGDQPSWGQPRPMVLDTAAARRLGFRPQRFARTIGTEIDWLAAAARSR